MGVAEPWSLPATGKGTAEEEAIRECPAVSFQDSSENALGGAMV